MRDAHRLLCPNSAELASGLGSRTRTSRRTLCALPRAPLTPLITFSDWTITPLLANVAPPCVMYYVGLRTCATTEPAATKGCQWQDSKGGMAEDDDDGEGIVSPSELAAACLQIIVYSRGKFTHRSRLAFAG